MKQLEDSYMNISSAHVQQMKRVLLVPSSAWHGSAARELQIHLDCETSIFSFQLYINVTR